jgi:hypothetical protein
MEPEIANYIIRHYGYLMTVSEKLAHRQLMATMKATHGRSDSMAQEEAKNSHLYSRFFPWDPSVKELAKDGMETFVDRAACRIMTEHEREVVLNRCPRCKVLARTPKAKQCRACRLDWHDTSTPTAG